VLPAPEPADVLIRREASRVYDFQAGELTVAGRATLKMGWEEYWPRFEEIAAEHLLVFEDDPDRDRETELFGVRFGG